MATSANINLLDRQIHYLWDLELREYELDKSFVLQNILHNLRELRQKLVEARLERLAKMGVDVKSASNHTS